VAVHLRSNDFISLPSLAGSAQALPRHPTDNRLPLLPLGPDGVHGGPPRGTQTSSLLGVGSSHVAALNPGIQPR